MLRKRRRLALGLQVVMTMFAHAKGAANVKALAPLKPVPEQTGRHDFTKLFADSLNPESWQVDVERRRDVLAMAEKTWKLVLQTTEDIAPKSTWPKAAEAAVAIKPLTAEEARLWLQSFNAGPYALLKYKGDVPYRETQNYAPRVMKYYLEDLSNSPYEEYIKTSAAKYGLDPQMIRAIMKTESDFNNQTVSSAGARGLMQVMPVVWKEIKAKYQFDWDYATGVFEPQKNIEVACAYLAWLRYDFLPRHFAEFERNPDAPSILVRDHERGVPDRPTPRIVAQIGGAKEVTTMASNESVKSPASVAAPSKAVKASPTVLITSVEPRPESLEKRKKVSVSRDGEKTVVKVQNTKGAAKKPGVAGRGAEKDVADTRPRLHHRTLKKPALAKAPTRNRKTT